MYRLSVCQGTSRNDSSYVIVCPVDFGAAGAGVEVTSAGLEGRCLRENSVADMCVGFDDAMERFEDQEWYPTIRDNEVTTSLTTRNANRTSRVSRIQNRVPDSWIGCFA